MQIKKKALIALAIAVGAIGAHNLGPADAATSYCIKQANGTWNLYQNNGSGTYVNTGNYSTAEDCEDAAKGLVAPQETSRTRAASLD